MASNHSIKALGDDLDAARRSYGAMIDRADRALENFRNDIALTLLNAPEAAEIGRLQEQLEIFEGLEKERDAARVRQELAEAQDRLNALSSGQLARLRHAAEDHARALSAAGIAHECAVNAALSRNG
jgi:hypothetical protein